MNSILFVSKVRCSSLLPGSVASVRVHHDVEALVQEKSAGLGLKRKIHI